jgi:hypothetical protein
MSIFNNILEKLGFDKLSAKTASAPRPIPASKTASAPQGAPKASRTPTDNPRVDVTAKLEGLAASNGQRLNWKESIVDLLKLLGLDSSLEARKQLAKELGCPAEKMGDSAQMNIWLHRAVLRKLADNGGNVPKELLN